jgi:4-alpha-glucanotransferase
MGVMSSDPSQSLHDLARAMGIATDFWDWQGQHTVVSAESIRTVLAALDVDASTEEAAQQALADRELATWRRALPPTVVAREGWTPWVPVHIPHGQWVELEIELEDGSGRQASQVDRWVEPRPIDGMHIGEATFELPGDLPCGWHTLIARAEGTQIATATLIVTPQRLTLPESLGERAATGLMAQLYQVRSAQSWGIGDLHDLATLAAWGSERLGADFVLVNPLHAAEPVTPVEPSPYLPTTRRFVNPIYLHVEDIPEVANLDEAAAARVAELGREARELNSSETIDRDAAWPLKREALELVHAVGLTGRRAADYERYTVQEGEGLTDFATWCAIADVHGLPATDWPIELAFPRAAGVTEFRESHRAAIDFHCWLQWILDRQLGEVQRRAKDAGMALGVIHDLAVGVHPAGADAWALSDALARGVTVGAPPDQFNQLGQNWSQPPWRPDRLAELGYAPFRDMVRTVLRDSGGVRVDHIIGLFRLWWIPEGHSPAEGTYVRYDHEALIGILALEAQRAGAVVIGEDLGVVEPSTREYLLERGLLGTSIMWFEWADGKPLPPEGYRELCFSSVTTHDLPPTAGYLALEHVAVRDRLGLLTRSVEEEAAQEQQSIAAVGDALKERGLLAPDGGDAEDYITAMHAWLAQTPSRMLAYSLADLVGDKRAVNQPGTNREYPNWSVPLAGPDGETLSLEEAMASDLTPRLAQALRGQAHD